MMPAWADGTLCTGLTRAGTPCTGYAIHGLGPVPRCLHHVDDELLELAEEIVGFQRCRKRSGQLDACLQFAVADTDPPLCKCHGANRGSVRYRQAIIRRRERVMLARQAEILGALQAERDGDRDLATAMIIGGDRGRAYLEAAEGRAGDA